MAAPEMGDNRTRYKVGSAKSKHGGPGERIPMGEAGLSQCFLFGIAAKKDLVESNRKRAGSNERPAAESVVRMAALKFF